MNHSAFNYLVLKIDSQNPQIYLDLAWSHFNLNQYDPAKNFAFQYNSLAPNSGHGYKLLAGIYKKVGKENKMKTSAQRAEKFYLKELKSRPTDRLDSLAWLYLDYLPQPIKALEFAEKNIALKKTADAHALLGWAFYKNNELNKALMSYKKSTQMNPNIADSWYRTGIIYKELNQNKQASKAWEKGLKLGPKTWHMEMNEELLLLEGGT